ncbi:HpcH/HpaI aldolase/citrate lyase family protein [Novosphingobium mathurense]|uniref:Citrate lyase subunit beta / citryl-CoA lyase/(S)-citramalyl-CoA lyase n=1 Tax=Novosphingobium mathurense TaxID=428990 RepID=A0A1U6H666_9SPHN|nr:CoA ester lyase [Novosphingobium mathurense]SLJ91265.1 citrate lyase subunit beta / citryl-CoA lyase/(S)-citramalyl-CoA lyase [Novosphingobium mathurense]
MAPARPWAGRSLLFVPGDRPDRFDKALKSTAAVVCLDLEDAVAPADKPDARQAVMARLAERPDPRLAVRINTLASRDGMLDLLALEALPSLPLILVPKVESAEELRIAAAVLGHRGPALVPLVETLPGIARAAEIAGAPFCAALMFGGADYAAELGVAPAWEPLLAARHALVAAGALGGVPVIDMPWLDIEDEAGLMDEANRARALGFSAKAAIHPAQVDPIEAAFRPSEAEIAHAHAAVERFEEAGGRAIRFEGELLDAPVIKRYRRLLALSGALA